MRLADTPPTGWDEFDAIIDTIRTSAKGTWLDLWAGAVAINAMCIGTSGRAGVAVMAEGLKVTLTARMGLPGFRASS